MRKSLKILQALGISGVTLIIIGGTIMLVERFPIPGCIMIMICVIVMLTTVFYGCIK